MKAGFNKENYLLPPESDFTSPERKEVQKVLRFQQELTPDRPVHQKFPSLLTKDFRHSLRNKQKRKKDLESERKSQDYRNSPVCLFEIKASMASTDVRGLSLFNSEVDSKKEAQEERALVNQSISEKLICESFCNNCEKYVYTKVAFIKREDYLCCFKGLLSCYGETNGQEIHHLCSKCNSFIWKIGISEGVGN